MTRVLLADDEPLVLIGMQSMLDWNALGYELVGTARNGGEALEKIDELQPDIVVSDIRMPVLDGLQLAARVHEQYGPLPVFIMLTSYEEFDYVRRSMGLGAVDYLIKMDLTADGLREALERARTAIEKEKALRAPAPPAPGSLESYRERFFIQLYSGAFPNDEVIRTYCRELGLKPDAAAYTAVIANIRNRDLTPEQQVALSAGVTRMAADILPKYLRCQVTGMDLRHFNVLLLLDSRTGWEETLAPILQKVNDILYKYFSTTLYEIGCKVNQTGLREVKVIHVYIKARTVQTKLFFCILQKESSFSYSSSTFDTNQACAPVYFVHKISAYGSIGMLNQIRMCSIKSLHEYILYFGANIRIVHNIAN